MQEPLSVGGLIYSVSGLSTLFPQELTVEECFGLSTLFPQELTDFLPRQRAGDTGEHDTTPQL